MREPYEAGASEQYDDHDPTICFEICSEGVGRRYACVNARDEAAAKARMAPLFPGCDLVRVSRDPVI